MRERERCLAAVHEPESTGVAGIGPRHPIRSRCVLAPNVNT